MAKALLATTLQEVTKEVKDVGNDIGDIYPEARDKKVNFLGHKLDVPVLTPMEEYLVMLWSAIKTWAIVHGKIAAIGNEKDFIDRSNLQVRGPDLEIDDDVLAQCTGPSPSGRRLHQEDWLHISLGLPNPC